MRRKLEILSGAATVFRRNGFEASGMREIAAALDMTPGNLYYYFKNKEEILYFCQDYSLDRLLKSARSIRDARVPADEKLRRLIIEQIRTMLDELGGSSAHIEFNALSPPLLNRIIGKRNRYEAILREILREGMDCGAFRPCDEKMVSLAILGSINWTVRWYRPEGPETPERIADTFADYLIHGLTTGSNEWPKRKRKSTSR